jgi:hypothetical protein
MRPSATLMANREEESLGYLGVGQAFGDQLQNFPLASGEEVDPLLRPTFFLHN